MLDALVKQLPGVELKSDGRIYVNGRFVESLLLNARTSSKETTPSCWRICPPMPSTR